MSFGRLERTRPSAPLAEINMTPLIDVMLVLLVIFMVTAPLLVSGVKVDLPKAEGAAALSAPQFVSIGVDAAGTIYLDEAKVDLATLATRLQATAQRRADTEVQLRADQGVPYGRVLEVMGLAQKAGLSRIGFVADATPEPKP